MLLGFTPNPGAAAGGGSVASDLTTATFTTSIDNYGGYVFRMVTPAVDGDFTSLQIEMLGRADAGEASGIAEMFIGLKASSGDAWDSSTDPMQEVTVGSASTFTVPTQVVDANPTVSDSISLTGSSGDKLIISFRLIGTTTDDIGKTTAATGWETYRKVSTDAGVADDSGFIYGSEGGSDVAVLVARITFS